MLALIRVFNISLFCCVSFVISSCANNSIRSYKQETDTAINLLQKNQLDSAIGSFSSNKDIMSSLELGSLYRMQQSYVKSNTNFSFANSYVNKWLASFHNSSMGAVGDTLQAGLVNDKVLDYQLKDYEKVMLSTYTALNYISLGDLDNARVEVKRMYQVEDRIRQYREELYQNSKQKNSENASSDGVIPKEAPTLEQVTKKNASIYNFDFINKPSVLELQNSYQSAFSHYIAGFVFESLGEYDLARPGYVRASQLNPSNQLIKSSISQIDNITPVNNNQTDVLFIGEVGHAPQIKSVTMPIPWVQKSNGNKCFMATNISLPMLILDKHLDSSNSFLVDSSQYNMSLLTDINLMVARSLHDNLSNIFIRNILRVARDYSIQQIACNNGDSIGFVSLLGGSIINGADERTWVMLPSKVYAQRLKLTRGVHVLRVVVNGNQINTKINLTSPYQIITWRIIGDRVYFSQ